MHKPEIRTPEIRRKPESEIRRWDGKLEKGRHGESGSFAHKAGNSPTAGPNEIRPDAGFYPREAGSTQAHPCAAPQVVGSRQCGIHARRRAWARLTRRQPPHARARALPGTALRAAKKVSLSAKYGRYPWRSYLKLPAPPPSVCTNGGRRRQRLPFT